MEATASIQENTVHGLVSNLHILEIVNHLLLVQKTNAKRAPLYGSKFVDHLQKSLSNLSY